MLGLVKPRHFIPIHGEYRMLVQHGLLAEGAGVSVDGIFVLRRAGGRVRRHEGAPGRERAGRRGPGRRPRAVDGVDGVILRDRRALASDGVLMVALTVDRRHRRRRSAGPDLVGRGFLPDPDDPVLEAACKHLIEALLERAGDAHAAEAGYLKAKIRDTCSADTCTSDQSATDDPAHRAGGLSPDGEGEGPVPDARNGPAGRRTTGSRSAAGSSARSGALVFVVLAFISLLAVLTPDAAAGVTAWHDFLRPCSAGGCSSPRPCCLLFALMLWMRNDPGRAADLRRWAS